MWKFRSLLAAAVTRSVNSLVNLDEGAVEGRSSLVVLPEYEYEMRPARVEDFRYLDLIFYENHQRRLEQRGFRILGDMEDLSLSSAGSACRTFMRYMIDGRGSVVANIYHLVPSWLNRLKGGEWQQGG